MSPQPEIPAFGTPQLALVVEQLPPERIDELPFGAVRLDRGGNVVFYSAAERLLSGFHRDALGRSFFTEIAPCMNNAAFRGRIERAIERGRVDIELEHVGDFNDLGRELQIRVQSSSDGGCWIFIRRG